MSRPENPSSLDKIIERFVHGKLDRSVMQRFHYYYYQYITLQHPVTIIHYHIKHLVWRPDRRRRRAAGLRERHVGAGSAVWSA